VARLGGDEFTFLLEDITSSNDIPVVTDKIIETVSKPVLIDDRELFITASVGISRFPGDGKSGVELLKNADTAMYRAKDEGRNNYQFYSVEMGKKAHERLNLETHLRHAIKHNEFFLEYQPQFNIDSGKIVSLEALVRLNHPKKGVVMPGEFIPLLEETGLIVTVGEWILESACQQSMEWELAGAGAMPVYVNLSARQFKEKNLVATIEKILTKTGLPASRLGIEITESVLMQHSEASTDILNSCSEMGVIFALDDFGTGYSSLSYLKRFPISTLKIDKSFIHNINRDTENSEIVKAVLAMGNSLDLSVVAEGVESAEEMALLQRWGCTLIQGYLLGTPVSANKILDMLKSNYQFQKRFKGVKDSIV
jgi:EAL domain-containing protein (putative c-di-GMP-specific phosphodiesterase class I)